MNKKKLPRAIRPSAAHALGDKPGAVVREKEPWELKPAASAAESDARLPM